MRNIFIFMLFIFATSSFANTINTYKFDDVDSLEFNGKIVSVEDLRDGFSTITGVQVEEDTITVPDDSNAIILLRNTFLNKFHSNLTTDAKMGGEMGGG